LSGRLRLSALVFISELPCLIEHALWHDVTRFNPALSLFFVARAHPKPTLFLAVITWVWNIDRVQNVNRIAATDFQEISRDNRS